jgi:gliding motility-associated-like protein
VLIRDDNGCEYELNDVTLIDAPEECIRIPNAFTPNGDGVNDVWEIENIEMFPNAQISVYNRWGQIIYSANPNSEKWDGTNKNGNHVPTGTYTYVVNLFNNSKPKTGNVSVVY